MPSRTCSYLPQHVVGFAVDPIHVGTGRSLGHIDLTIVRDPVTQIPKIPGSSLAGVYRAYAALAMEEQRAQAGNQARRPYYPNCAGQGGNAGNEEGGHCRSRDCEICTTFGFARDGAGGFAGLASFSDAHVLLFPVATRIGPVWITSPDALRQTGVAPPANVDDDRLYYNSRRQQQKPLNLGWLLLPVEPLNANAALDGLKDFGVLEYVRARVGLVSDKLFSHIVNSNLEVRTSVSIDPQTGAARSGALFTYEALPRSTVLAWTIICRNPAHFTIDGQEVNAVRSCANVLDVVKRAHPYLEHLGIGGMGTRGMGRLRVLHPPLEGSNG
ncbi:MAG: type III-B CRISPR module RAMP protein Cmr4 [Rhodospirillales bacterium]|nr:type III-B CRISPR module RAMP protein Cmr4 [Rhodospirillales bacterium]